jgi:hypothetical protein
MMFSVDETAHILYDDGLYQDGDPISPWFNGEKINVTVMGVLNDVAMVLPWCNGHEMILPVSQLMKGEYSDHVYPTKVKWSVGTVLK